MIAAVVVLYHPDPVLLTRLFESVTRQVDYVIAVDNTDGSSETRPAYFEQFSDKVSYIPLGTNQGIAEAQNVGIQESIQAGCSHVLLLDQDSVPSPRMVETLLAAETELLNKGEKLGGMAPQVVDSRSGRRPCACRYNWFMARQVFCDVTSTQPVETDTFIASGALIRTLTLQTLGAMRSDLFIDHVDTEWALRARSAGYKSYCVPSAILSHSFGDATTKLFGKSIYLHSDVRHYYQLRNEIYLVRLKTMGWQWRAYILPRIFYHLFLYSQLSGNRIRAVRLLLKAIGDGMLGRLGPIMEPSNRRGKVES